LIAFLPPAYADVPTSIDASTALATAEQSPYNIPVTSPWTGYSLNYIEPPAELQVQLPPLPEAGQIYSFGYLTYGDPHGNMSGGYHRYIGYDYYGNDLDNIAYPPDSPPNGASFDATQWIPEPWTVPAIGINKTQWDSTQDFDFYGQPAYDANDLLKIGMLCLGTTTGVGGKGNGYTTDMTDGNTLWANLVQYINIMAPPTFYTWGIGRMWHLENGSYWYVTIPMPPLVCQQLYQQPEVMVTPASPTILVSGTQNFTATYYPNGQFASGTPVTTQAAWSAGDTTVATIGASTGIATGVAVGTTPITATYTPPGGSMLTGTATLTVAQPEPELVVAPQAPVINVGDQQPFTATYYPSGQNIGGGTDVTQQSTWTDDSSSVASIEQDTGVATGVGQGTTTVTAVYTPSGGSALTDQAGLTVQQQQQQQQQTGSGGMGTLTFHAHNQANIQTLYGTKVGGTLKRGQNIALWTDSVTATLAVSQPPTPTNIPQGGSFAGFINWGIASATLNGIPIQNPAFTFDNPVEPSAYKTLGMNSQGTVSSGNATAVSPGFEEDWSEDGIGYGTTGPQGIMDALNGQKVAVYPKSYQLSATYVVNYTYYYIYWVPGNNNHPGHWATGTASGSGSLTATQALWVCGTGAVPVTGTGGHLAVVASLANPQTHP
jgi:hypothetical protein